MHAHSIQPNPYAALDALRSAQKTAAKREAELVRKELLESASELAGESDISDVCALQIDEREESRKPAKRRNEDRQNKDRQNQEQEEESAGPQGSDEHISDWA